MVDLGVAGERKVSALAATSLELKLASITLISERVFSQTLGNDRGEVQRLLVVMQL